MDSLQDVDPWSAKHTEQVPRALPPLPATLHRLATVRRRQEVSLRTVSRLLGITREEAAQQEQETSDLSLSVLYRWQQVLNVPISELLHEAVDDLAPPVRDRARLIQVMKTAATLKQRADSPRIRRLAERLIQQLLELMPELHSVTPTPEGTGHHRRQANYGRILDRQVSPRLSRAMERTDGPVE